MARRAVLVLIPLAVAGGLLASRINPAGARRPCRGVTDNVLCLPLPRAWSSSVSFGSTPGGPGAWMLAGNFHFSKEAANPVARPKVTRSKALISIGDVPVRASQRRWPRVERLRLPARRSTWHVRFHGRALYLSVQFGTDCPRLRQMVNRRLAAVRFVG